ncbi:MAG: hypothetical protein LBV04_06705 [Deferribacteraceae bacterium]|jgi:hypothetical protein|nr:hypothetical protein [Deferribacteraceae bacterium]
MKYLLLLSLALLCACAHTLPVALRHADAAVERCEYENSWEVGKEPDGVVCAYYESGALYLQYENKPKSDDYQYFYWYYESGALEWEMHHTKEGIRDGIQRGYHENGELKGEALFKNDVMVKHKVYATDGSLIYTVIYDDNGKFLSGSCANGNTLAEIETSKEEDYFKYTCAR